MKEADLIKYKNIPDELKLEKRWCLYKIIVRDGKNTKMPSLKSIKAMPLHLHGLYGK